MTHSVRLARLPHGLKFPGEMAGKVFYDAAKQQLEFAGFMSKTDFDKLLRLSNDIEYQRALEKLFQACTFAPTQPASRLPWIGAILAAAAVTIGLVWFLRFR